MCITFQIEVWESHNGTHTMGPALTIANDSFETTAGSLELPEVDPGVNFKENAPKFEFLRRRSTFGEVKIRL